MRLLTYCIFSTICYCLCRSTNNLHVECAACQHSWECALTLTDGECLSLVVPSETDGRVHSLLIVVVVALILVECELCIGTRINNDVYIVIFILVGILYIWSERKDTTCLDEER